MAPFQLSDEIEKMIAERAPTGNGHGSGCLMKQQHQCDLLFQGSEVTEAEILDALSNTDPSKRKEAGHSAFNHIKGSSTPFIINY